MKLLFVPWFLWTIAEWHPACAPAPRRAPGGGPAGGTGRHPAAVLRLCGDHGVSVAVVNILIFQTAVLLAFWVSTALQRRGALTGPVWQAAAVLVLLGTCAAFAAWTVLPPELPVFTDPTAGNAGRHNVKTGGRAAGMAALFS